MIDHYQYKQALLYCRVSSLKQVKEGDGLRSQTTACKTFIRSHNWNLEKTFWERGIKGGNDFRTRPAMQLLLQYLDDHPETNYVVVVDDIKRWARATLFHLELKKELAKRNAVMASPKLPFVLNDSPESIYFETCLAAQAQLEGEQNRRQAMSRMHSRLMNGYAVFRAPAGYSYRKVRNNGKCLFPNDKAPIIQKALEKFATGALSTQTEVAQFLFENGFQDHKVHPDVVKKILTNVMYAGYVQKIDWNIPLTKANHQALISFDTHTKIQERLKKKKVTSRKTDDDHFPMRRKVRCWHCKKTLVGSFFHGRKSKYPFYSCLNSQCEAKPKYIRREKIEDAFLEILGNARPSDTIIKAFELVAQNLYKEFKAHYRYRISLKEKQIRQYEDRITDLMNKAFETTSKALERRYDQEIVNLEEEIAKISAPRKNRKEPSFQEALAELSSFCNSPLEHWEKSSIKAKNRLFNIMFDDKLEYSEKGGYRTAPFSRHYCSIEQFGNLNSILVDQREKSLIDYYLELESILIDWWNALKNTD